MPTGVALRDARAQLFAAAEQVVLRDGPSGLTSRAVTAEAGVAKGVLHRHFADFEDFLAGLIRERAAAIAGLGEKSATDDAPSRTSVVEATATTLTTVFNPLTLALIGVVANRPAVRERLHIRAGLLPLLAEAVSIVAGNLHREQRAGRLRADADPDRLAFALVGTAHLLFGGELGGLPDRSAVEEIVEGALVGALRGDERAPRNAIEDPQ
jgi:AcrR family transcriptional regulator